MSIESIGGIAASAAGSSRAQSTGTDIERSQQDAADRARQIESNRQADRAAGIAQADGQDLDPNDRDPDGRQPWQRRPVTRPAAAPHPSADGKSIDDHRGNALDLTA